jgi:hypothetical protein
VSDGGAFPVGFVEWRDEWRGFGVPIVDELERVRSAESWFPTAAPFPAGDLLGRWWVPWEEVKGGRVQVELWEVVFPGFGAGVESCRAVGVVVALGRDGRFSSRFRQTALCWSWADVAAVFA